jgi:hypothetical protein
LASAPPPGGTISSIGFLSDDLRAKDERILALAYNAKWAYGSNAGEVMLKSVEGIFRDGKVELLEAPPQTREGRVLVTFLSESTSIDLGERGIAPAQAADLRSRLARFSEDWDRPEMDVYDEL